MKNKMIPLTELTDSQIIAEARALHEKGEALFFTQYFSQFYLQPSNDFMDRILDIKDHDARYTVITILFNNYANVLSTYKYGYIEKCAEANDVNALRIGIPYITANTEYYYEHIMNNIIMNGVSAEIIEVLNQVGISIEKYIPQISLEYLIKCGTLKSITSYVKSGGKIIMTKDQEDILQYLRMHYGKSFIITEN